MNPDLNPATVPPLGQILVNQGLLSEKQLEAALATQKATHQPLGLICETLFLIDPSQIEDCWAEQYAHLTRTVDPETECFDNEALTLITRRQAWQFRILPLRFDHHNLMIATTRHNLRRALRFATNVLHISAFFVMADPQKLGEAMCRHYPLPGMTPDMIDNHQNISADSPPQLSKSA